MALVAYEDPLGDDGNAVTGAWTKEQREQESKTFEERIASGGSTTVTVSNMSHMAMTESSQTTWEDRALTQNEEMREMETYREKRKKSMFLADEKQKYLARIEKEGDHTQVDEKLSERLLVSTKSSSRASLRTKLAP